MEELYTEIGLFALRLQKQMQAAAQILDPIIQVLSGYNIEESARMHWQRVL